MIWYYRLALAVVALFLVLTMLSVEREQRELVDTMSSYIESKQILDNKQTETLLMLHKSMRIFCPRYPEEMWLPTSDEADFNYKERWMIIETGTSGIIKATKTYHGFEAAVDLERDISEVWEEMGVPGEFQGTLEVSLVYHPAKGDEYDGEERSV